MGSYTVCRGAELGEGQKVVKEVAGRRILLVRRGGEVFAMDANCYHMGWNLGDGDLEDLGEHPCVVCPGHRHRINMRTGQKMDHCTGACASTDQVQRTYQVFSDGEKIQVYIPDAQLQQLPSDKYNYWGVQQAMATPPRQNFGLFGSVANQQQPPTPPSLEPYAGASPEPRVRGQAQQQGQIQFRAARARAAIMANYKPPPMAEALAAPGAAPRGLFGAPGASSTSSSGLTRQQVRLAGPQDMEMD